MRAVALRPLKYVALILMLAYVLIPHQGDFLDMVSMSSGVRSGMLLVSDDHGHQLSPLQSLFHKTSALTQSQPSPAQEEDRQNLQHPETYTLSAQDLQSFVPPVALFFPLAVNGLAPPIRSIQFQLFFSKTLREPPQLTRPRHLDSTVLLI